MVPRSRSREPSREPMKNARSIETLCVHAGVEPEPHTGAIMTPIFQTSTYVQKGPGQHQGYDYSRGGNPTRTALEKSLAGIEGARHAITYSSGLAAEQAIAQTLSPGEHVIVSHDTYGGTGRLFRRLFAKYDLRFDFVDLTDLDELNRLVNDRTRIVWLETPTNPLLSVIDIAKVVEIAHRVRARVVVDNTFSTPVLQRPLEYGADVVCYSTTKYIGGHSDLIGGSLALDDDELAE